MNYFIVSSILIFFLDISGILTRNTEKSHLQSAVGVHAEHGVHGIDHGGVLQALPELGGSLQSQRRRGPAL